MTPNDFAALDLSRYELTLRASESVSLPAFLGSTLRGAFGHALKEAVCVMNHRDCVKCLVADRCIYPYLFETPVPPDVPQLRGQAQAPHPFILTPPMLKGNERAERVSAHSLSDGRTVRLVHSPATDSPEGRRRMLRGDGLAFGLLLMGRAVEYLPYVVYAVSEMARRGLGVERAPFELTEVAMIDESGNRKAIYSGESQRIIVPGSATRNLSDSVRWRLDQLVTTSEISTDKLRLKFLTPARIRVEGDLQVGMNFELLARNLLRRVSMLAAVHGRARLDWDYRGLIARAGEVETRSSALRWFDLERYSNRQQTKMSLGGFIGEVEYSGKAIKELLPLMAAGEILHVGAGTSFGLGRYEIVALSNKRPDP
jgi:hypothetical protein